MKEFRAAAHIKILLLFDFAKLELSPSEEVSIKGADLGIIGKGPPEADLRVREIHLDNSVMQFFPPLPTNLFGANSTNCGHWIVGLGKY